MKRFEQDAMRWEAGGLSLAELEARHPGEDVRGLVELFGRLETIAQIPTPDPEPAWTALRARLPERARGREGPGRVERLRWRMRRSLVAAAVAGLLGGTSIAYAAGVEPVRHDVNQVIQHVTSLFSGDEGGSANDAGQQNADVNEVGSGKDRSGGTRQSGSSRNDQQSGSSGQDGGGSTGSNEGGSTGDQQGSGQDGNAGTGQGDSDDDQQSGSEQGDQGGTGTSDADSSDGDQGQPDGGDAGSSQG